MGIDLKTEKAIGLAEAGRRLPGRRPGKPITPSCVWRWVKNGVRLDDGRVVRLEAVRVGAAWLTSVEALQRFADAQTPQALAAKPGTIRGKRKPSDVQKQLDGIFGQTRAQLFHPLAREDAQPPTCRAILEGRGHTGRGGSAVRALPQALPRR